MDYRKLKNSELNRRSVESFKNAKKTAITLVLDNIRSAHNIGSVFRTADAFLIKKIYLCGVCATPPDKNIRKTALGATESIAWEYIKDTNALITQLRQQGTSVISIEQAKNAQLLNEFVPSPDKEYAVVLGNEVKGVQQEVVFNSDHVVEVPQFGTKHSFNISVCAGIVCWDLFTKLH